MKLTQIIKRWFNPVPGMPARELYLRLVAIAVMAMLAYAMAKADNPFFYQAF